MNKIYGCFPGGKHKALTMSYDDGKEDDKRLVALFNKYGICVRSGEHCAKLIHNHLGVDQTIRASVCFYNTKEEIDYFIEICKKGGDFLDAFFD